MRCFPAVAALITTGGLIGGCESSPAPRPSIPGDEIAFSVGERTLRVEVVFDNFSRMKGLKYRESLPEDSGMLFIFPTAEKQSFWMKDTLVPLSIAFLDDDGKILQIEDMRPKDRSSTESKYRVRFALEVNQGWFRKAGLGIGSRLPEFREKVQRFRAR